MDLVLYAGNILIRDKRLTDAMTSIGFTVRVYDNFRTKGVLEKIGKYAMNEEMGKCNAFGLAFLSHGHENGDLATFDGMTNVKTVIGQVKGSTLLAGKPKLFFFQGQLLILIHLFQIFNFSMSWKYIYGRSGHSGCSSPR